MFLVGLILTLISWLFACLGHVRGTTCIANGICMCRLENSSNVIKNLLDYNWTPENEAILFNIFNVTPFDGLANLIYKIDCHNMSFKEIPRFKRIGYSNQPNSACLDLRFNMITELKISQFVGLLINCIDLGFNRIQETNMNSLAGLVNILTVLKLNDNQFDYDNAFTNLFLSKLIKLRGLFLGTNRITTIFENSFSYSFRPTLEIFDLKNNQITYISNKAFSGFTSLSYLNLCNNLLGEYLLFVSNNTVSLREN